jgi:hypothetical protein
MLPLMVASISAVICICNYDEELNNSNTFPKKYTKHTLESWWLTSDPASINIATAVLLPSNTVRMSAVHFGWTGDSWGAYIGPIVVSANPADNS